MNDLSLKPKQPEKEPKKISSSGLEKKAYVILLFAIVFISLLSFFLVTLRGVYNKMKDDKIRTEAVESYKDSVKTVIKIDTVYLPGKIVESKIDACYDVSDCNTIHITVNNGVLEITSEN